MFKTKILLQILLSAALVTTAFFASCPSDDDDDDPNFTCTLNGVCRSCPSSEAVVDCDFRNGTPDFGECRGSCSPEE